MFAAISSTNAAVCCSGGVVEGRKDLPEPPLRSLQRCNHHVFSFGEADAVQCERRCSGRTHTHRTDSVEYMYRARPSFRSFLRKKRYNPPETPCGRGTGYSVASKRLGESAPCAQDHAAWPQHSPTENIEVEKTLRLKSTEYSLPSFGNPLPFPHRCANDISNQILEVFFSVFCATSMIEGIIRFSSTFRFHRVRRMRRKIAGEVYRPEQMPLRVTLCRCHPNDVSQGQSSRRDATDTVVAYFCHFCHMRTISLWRNGP